MLLGYAKRESLLHLFKGFGGTREAQQPGYRIQFGFRKRSLGVQQPLRCLDYLQVLT